MSELERDQEIVDRIKEQIKLLPDFVTETEENRCMRCYALLEAAVDFAPDMSFIVDAMAEVESFYIDKKIIEKTPA